MRLPLSIAGALIGLALAPSPASARSIGGGGMHSGPYNSSAMAVQRERQERAKNCARLHPGFESGTMTYPDRKGRRIACP